MQIEGVARAQGRTHHDLLAGQIWSLDRLCVPHLPKTIGHYMRRPGTSLDIPADPDVPLGKLTPMEAPMVSVEMAPDSFSADHFTEDGLYIEDMPIKVPGGKITLPHNVFFGPFQHMLSDMFLFEHENNPCIEEQYLYLTIQQSWVEAGTVQRIPGMHLDGFQKPTIMPQVAQHQLAITNAIPTEFVAKHYDRGALPNTKKELFAALTEQSMGCTRYKPLPYELHLLNAFCPHAPGVATKRTFRTFIRFSASVIPFMGAENTRNPFFDLKWDTDAKAAFYASIAA